MLEGLTDIFLQDDGCFENFQLVLMLHRYWVQVPVILVFQLEPATSTMLMLLLRVEGK